ncbi:MAG: hypothetical protein LBQ77_00775 [Treponema sp.]|jgi:hypothetical protein|nr:hypothetical protein [Treponema sp.]
MYEARIWNIQERLGSWGILLKLLDTELVLPLFVHNKPEALAILSGTYSHDSIYNAFLTLALNQKLFLKEIVLSTLINTEVYAEVIFCGEQIANPLNIKLSVSDALALNTLTTEQCRILVVDNIVTKLALPEDLVMAELSE